MVSSGGCKACMSLKITDDYDSFSRGRRLKNKAAHVWQKASEIEDAVVEDYIAAAKATGDEITVKGLVAWARDDDGGGGGGGGGEDGDDGDDPPTHACPDCGLMHVALRDRGGE